MADVQYCYAAFSVGNGQDEFKATRNTRIALMAPSMLDNLELISAKAEEVGTFSCALSRKRPQLDPVVAEVVHPAALLTWTIFSIL